MDQYVVSYNPLDRAIRSVISCIQNDPQSSVAAYHAMWQSYDARSVSEFSGYIYELATCASGTDNNATAAYQPSLQSALLGAMIARAAFPNAVAATSLKDAYHEVVKRIGDDGTLSLRARASSLHAFSEGHSLSYSSESRQMLRYISQQLAAHHEAIAYSVLLATLFMYSHMMHVRPAPSEVLARMGEDDFDTMLDLIASGHGGFLSS